MDAIRRAMRERVDQLRAEAEARAARHRAEVLEDKRAELHAALVRERAHARADARRLELEARGALLERVFALARERLGDAFARPAARARLVERAREALLFVPAGAATLACSPGVAELLEGHLDEREELAIETRAALPLGFRLEGAGGTVVVDGTLESLLEAQRPVLATQVLRRLAEEPT